MGDFRPVIVNIGAPDLTISRRDTVVHERAWTSEHRHDVALLLVCARTEVDDICGERIRSLVRQAPDWQWLALAADDQGVFPLLYHSLKRTAPEALPAASRTAWQWKFSGNAARNLVLARALGELLDVFEQNRIPALAYKGPLLAAAIYGNLTLRKSGDLDLLVPRGDFGNAKELLLARGYRTQMSLGWKDHLVHEADGINIDLHRKVAPRWCNYGISFRKLSERRTTIELCGRKVPTFSIEDLLIVLCLDIVRDTAEASYLRLFKLCDVGQVVNSFKPANWQLLVEKAERIGAKGALCVALRAADELLGIAMPDDVRAMVFSSAAAETIARHTVAMIRDGAPSQTRFPHRTRIIVNVRERPRDKLRVMLRSLVCTILEKPEHSGAADALAEPRG